MRITKKMVYETMLANPELFYKPMPDEWKKLFPVVTAAVLEECGLHLTMEHTGKMLGMQSMSTTCKCNNLCRVRIAKAYNDIGIEFNPDNAKEARAALKKYLQENPFSTNILICAFCFSDSQQDSQKTMQQPLFKNYEILNGGIVHDDWIPVINALYFRGESFGDFASENSVINFFNFARKNPLVNFTAWTKNLVFFGRAVEHGHTKPENFKLVFSSQYINKRANIPERYKSIVNAVFTVFTKEFAEKHNIKINCGARACMACLRCYANYDGTIKMINELLK